MKVTYKVIDTRTNEDITDKYDWVLQPNGRLAYNAYGDLIGLTYAEAVFTVDGIRQRQGKWILNHGIIDYHTCSCCGSMISQSQINRFFCPRCGAEMSVED